MTLADLLNRIQKAYAESLCLLNEATDTDALIASLETAHAELEEAYEFEFQATPNFEGDDPYVKVAATLTQTMIENELEDYVISFPPYRSIVESFHPLSAEVSPQEAKRFYESVDLFCQKWFSLLSTELKLLEPLCRLWETPWRTPPENVEKGHG